jgi:hypothetical protein
MMDDERDDETNTNTGTTRRHLLSAAGGFALATSGLFLPDGFGEAEARDGALGGTKGGRRGRDHRGRDKRRKHKDKRHRDTPRSGAGGLRNVALFVHNVRSTAVTVRQWKMIGIDEAIRWGTMTGWLTIDGKPASGPEHFLDFVTDLRGFALEISTGHVIEVGNPPLGFPWARVVAGGWSDHGWDPRGATLINQGFSEWATATASGFRVQRLNDTDTHKRFLLNLV